MAKIVRDIKDVKKIRELPPANSVKLKYGKGQVELESNGEIAALEINYRGAFKGTKRLGEGWMIKASKNKVLIISLAQTPISELLFTYIGELRIINCKYVNWDNVMKFAKVENYNRNEWKLSNNNWDSDGRKYEEIETESIIYRKVLKTMI